MSFRLTDFECRFRMYKISLRNIHLYGIYEKYYCGYHPCIVAYQLPGHVGAPQIMGWAGMEKSRWDHSHFKFQVNLTTLTPSSMAHKFNGFKFKKFHNQSNSPVPMDQCILQGICDMGFFFWGWGCGGQLPPRMVRLRETWHLCACTV